jgi:hypothetical protein
MFTRAIGKMESKKEKASLEAKLSFMMALGPKVSE